MNKTILFDWDGTLVGDTGLFRPILKKYEGMFPLDHKLKAVYRYGNSAYL